MALHSCLPIYKVAYDLLSVATDITKNMPRDFKASSHHDRARLANVVRRRGHAVDRDLTKTFRGVSCS